MTIIEAILLLAVAILAMQVVILQRCYNEKLADQAAVLTFVLDLLSGKQADATRINLIKAKIFHSSQ